VWSRAPAEIGQGVDVDRVETSLSIPTIVENLCGRSSVVTRNIVEGSTSAYIHMDQGEKEFEPDLFKSLVIWNFLHVVEGVHL
jgi:hypothetical protein